MNKKGQKPEDLAEMAAELVAVVPSKTLDYENVVGQDSLTRLDDRNRRRNKNKRNHRNKPKANAAEGAPQAAPSQASAPSNRRRNHRRNNRPKPE